MKNGFHFRFVAADVKKAQNYRRMPSRWPLVLSSLPWLLQDFNFPRRVHFCRKPFRVGVASDFSAANNFTPRANSPPRRIFTKKSCNPADSRRRCFSITPTRNSRRAISARPSPRIAGRSCSRRAILEIHANLGFVRNQVQGATIRESRWQDWLGQLTLNEWTLLAAGAFWLTFLLLAVGKIRPALVPKMRSCDASGRRAGGFLRQPCFVCRRRVIFPAKQLSLFPPKRPRAAGRLTRRKPHSRRVKERN